MSEYTPEQLRDWAKVEEEMGEQEGPVRAKLRQHVADQLRDLAAALEELAALRAELASVKSHADLMRVELLRFGTVAAEAARIAHDANEAALTYRAAHPKDAP